MNIEYLKTFIQIVETGSFTKAAQNMLIAQSTVSGRIREMEIEIDKILFEKGTKKPHLTPVGESFYIYAQKIVEMEKSMYRELSLVDKYSDSIHIGAVHNLYDIYTAELLANYISLYPDISTKVSIMHTNVFIANIDKINYDIIFIYKPFTHINYICEPYKKEKIVLATRYTNSEYVSGIKVGQLTDIPLIYSYLLNSVLPTNRAYPLDINVLSKIVPFLKSNDFYAFMPEKMISKELAEGTLINIPILDIELPNEQSYMIYKKNYFENGALEKLIKRD